MQEQKAIIGRMISIMSDIGPISKKGKNEKQGYKFRGIDQFVNALHPALVSNKVLMVPRVVKNTRELFKNEKTGTVSNCSLIEVCYDFTADDGSSITIGPISAEGMDSGDKATNKALSAALKYALIQTFCIPTEDMVDGDSDSPNHDDGRYYQNHTSQAPTKPSTPKFDIGAFMSKAKTVTSLADLDALYKANKANITADPLKDDAVQLFKDLSAQLKSVENDRKRDFDDIKHKIIRTAFEESLDMIQSEVNNSHLDAKQVEFLTTLIKERRHEIGVHPETVA